MISNQKKQVLTLVSRLPERKRLLSSLPADTRLELTEALSRLEAAQSQSVSSTSSLLEGTWTFVLVGGPPPGLLSSPTREAALLLYAGGFSPGVFGLSLLERLPDSLLSVRSLSLTIKPTQPRLEVDTEVSVLGGNTTASVQVLSRLEVATGVRLTETWSEVIVNGTSVALPRQLAYSRQLFVAFVDDDLLILRDETGSPTILRRGVETPLPPPPPPAVRVTASAAAPGDAFDAEADASLGPVTITVEDEDPEAEAR